MRLDRRGRGGYPEFETAQFFLSAKNLLIVGQGHSDNAHGRDMTQFDERRLGR